MKKTKKQKKEIIPVPVNLIDNDDNEEQEVSIDNEVNQDDVDIERLRQEFGGNEYSIVVYKEDVSSGTFKRVKSFSTSSINPDLIADTYGGGKYKFKVIDNSGKIKKSWTTEYAEPIKKIDNTISTTTDTTFKQLEILQKEKNDLLNSVLNLVNNLSSNKNSSIDEIIKYKSLFENKSPVNFSDMIELIRLGFEYGMTHSQIEAGQPAENVIMNKLMDIIVPSLKMKGLNINPVTQTPEQSIHQLSQPNVIIEQKQGGNSMKEKEYISEFEKNFCNYITGNLNLIKQVIYFGTSPNLFANMVVEQLSENELIHLVDYLNSNENRVFELIPELNAHKTYILNVFNYIKKLKEQELEQKQEQLK
ncbi:MAG: hypothetical protein NC833_05720 [Candidatus Omnitrophica bacterium]|nr:hypothetical protein [Candidatus Omnitrophota bacterium]